MESNDVLKSLIFLLLQRYGQGVMKYSNGDVYEGVFEYDLCNKNGKMTYKDGSVYEGSWLNGLVGIIVATLTDKIFLQCMKKVEFRL